jgi:3-methyladenine DNA glycosylase AlkD
MTAAEKIFQELRQQATPEKAAGMRRFFKTGVGEYGEGDQFLGVPSPPVRAIVRRHRCSVLPDDLAALLASPWHEARFAALALLVELSKRADGTGQRVWADFYLEHRAAVNNWDLVDISAPQALGPVACDAPEILWRLARSGNLWEERIALLATFFDIRRHRFEHTLALAVHFLHHPHDLIHKATGWMLREAGKRDEAVLLHFLDAHATAMPRTMLRYAIEKLTPHQREIYMRR